MKGRIALLFLLTLLLAGTVYVAVSISGGLLPTTVTLETSSTTCISPTGTGEDNTGTAGSDPTTGAVKTTAEITNPTTSDEPDPTTGSETGYRVVSFFGMGDDIIHKNVINEASKRMGGTSTDFSKGFDFAPAYAAIAQYVKKADIAFVNQETTVCGDETKEPSGYPLFNTPRALGDTLVDLGFNVINMAHNHMCDMGASGLSNSLDYWRTKKGVTAIGVYKNEQEYKNLSIITKNGIKIAFLSYSTFTNVLPKDNSVYIPLSSNMTTLQELTTEQIAAYKTEITAQIKSAREKADCVIVSMHWGQEDQYYENDSQKEIAQAIVDAGADVILGTHPHVLQDMKWKTRPDGGKTLICYSLGNTISTMHYLRNMLAGFVTFDITKDGDKAVEIKNVVFTPTMNYYEQAVKETELRYNIHLMLFKDFTIDNLKKHGSILYQGITNVQKEWDTLVKNISDHIPDSFIKN
ncbi:MAG: CapA family protein [Oscillospiraceae bacterium]|nr:CapA family protein [Oscillospiraceae bacterium]